jgi:hypothetical protein
MVYLGFLDNSDYMTKRTIKPLITHPKKQGREMRAAFAKERIYGSVTILAVNFSMLFKSGVTVADAYITVIATIGGLWMASLFASVLGYRIVHDKNMPRDEFIHELAVHRGMLLAAVPSMIMFSLAAFDLVSIRTALIVDIALAMVALSVTIFRSGKTRSNSYITAFVSVAIQVVIAGLIILLKLGAESEK